jgi:class 3 adenylate cyclase
LLRVIINIFLKKTLRPKHLARVLLVFLLLQATATHLSAQQAIINLTDSTDVRWIGKSIYYLKDADKKIKFSEILSGAHDSAFIKSEQEAPNFGNIETTVWNKFTVTTHTSRKWMLSVLNYNIDTLTFYYRDTGGVFRELVSGSSRPLSSRRYKSGYYSFELPVEPGDTATFYLKVQTYIFQYPLVISTYEKYISELHVNNLLKGLYFGFVFLIIIYNLVLFITLGDRNYLYYILYITFTALLMAEHAGINALLWGNKFHFVWNRGPMILSIASLFFLAFSKSFLETGKHTPRMHAVINYLFVPILCLNIVFNLLNKNLYASVSNQLVGFVILISMSINAIAVYRNGFRPARFYILACSFYFSGAVIFILKTFAVLPYNYFTTNAMEIGSAFEMMLFSISMADRINIFKKEKAQAQKDLVQSLQENEKLITEQNKTLEIKVTQRTSELQHTLAALEVSQQDLQQKNVMITREKDRSENLLLNILPYETAQELKENGSAAAKFYDNVTVMFTDFKDFTSITEKMEPIELVAELDKCFKAFDSIMDKHDIEKIKTIGDSYMAAVGLPVTDEAGVIRIVKAALDIQAFMLLYNAERTKYNQQVFDVRIGIHSGPAIAGIVGSKKFAYDIWGDTVNTASRMESSGETGKINISGTTHALIKDHFRCTYRGKIAAKNKGEIDMYFVEGTL